MDTSPLSFADLPEDVQLSILSFLNPTQVAIFSCTSRRFYSLAKNPNSKLWFSLCHRKFGYKTHISKWGGGKIPYKNLYSTLSEFDDLIGFWRLCVGRTRGQGHGEDPFLLFIEWGASFLLGSRVLPSQDGSYDVVKSPFLWMFLSEGGYRVNFLDPHGKGLVPESSFVDLIDGLELIPVRVFSMGFKHLLVEDNILFLEPVTRGDGFNGSPSSASLVMDEGEEANVDDVHGVINTVPDWYMMETYQYFANRTSTGSRGVSRRQRRRDRARRRRILDDLHFVKVVDCSPTLSRPLQGLWKGIRDNSKLGFYLVTYDEVGGIACRWVGESNGSFSGCTTVFWTPKTASLDLTFSPEEAQLFNSRTHLPIMGANHAQYRPLTENKAVCRVLLINSSDDLLIPGLAGGAVNSPQIEGRAWQYGDGTFGFGFLRDSFVIDLKHMTLNGCLLDSVAHRSG